MRLDSPHVARHVEDVPNKPGPGTVFDLATAVVGLVGVALFGLGLEVRGGIWPAVGVVVCVAVVAISGYNLTPSTPNGSHRRRTPPVQRLRAKSAISASDRFERTS